MMACTLGTPDLTNLTHNHLTQIQAELWNRGGGPEGKIINAFFSGATPAELISKEEVTDYVDRIIDFYGNAKKGSDYIDQLKREREYMHTATEMPSEMQSKKSTMEVYDEISLDWKTQIYNHVVREFGGKPSSYLQGMARDTLLPQIAVEEFAKTVIDEYDGNPRLAADVLKAAMTEHITLMSATMMNQAMKEQGLMGQITKVTDNMIEQVNTKGTENEELIKLIEGANGEKGPAGPRPNLELRKPKRKKSKPKSQHLPNMQAKSVKRVLGASILTMLGTAQRDTQDAQKRALLKELPAADIIEMATGEKLPDYQANLINAIQAKVDPEAPIVKRMESTIHLANTIADIKDAVSLDDSIEVNFIGGNNICDLKISTTIGSWIIHYERFTDDAAKHLGTTADYISERIANPEFYEGLRDCVSTRLPTMLSEWKQYVTSDQISSLIGKLVAGYTSGYVQAFIEKEHEGRQATTQPQAAVLG